MFIDNATAGTGSINESTDRPNESFRRKSDSVAVLLVDSDPEAVFRTENALHAAIACTVDTAASGEEALAKLDSGQYHAILLDNSLSDMTGIEVLSRLRASSCDVPVILVTASGSESTVVEAMHSGANDYVVKSGGHLRVIPEVLSQVIDRDRVRRRADLLEIEHLRFARLAAIGEVAAGIAHEIRNPMTVISGMASLIRDSHQALGTEDIEKCAQAIVDNCAHLTRILEELLQGASRSSSRELLGLREVVQETLSFMRFDSDWRNLMDVRTDYRADVMVLGSRDELKQVFINLLRNAAQAVKLAGRGAGHLGIGLCEDKDRNEVVLSISDNGQGIPLDVMPHIFESGFSTKRRGGQVQGTGLGLSICRRIVESHGGRLWAQNNEDEGATFSIALPCAPKI